MKKDLHAHHDFFEFIRLEDSVPPSGRNCLDVALLDMNHWWPNVGHDSLAHAVLEAATDLRPQLIEAGMKIRVLSFDVRRRLLLPDAPNGRYQLYIGTGGPGHLDPRENDGVSDVSQGIDESTEWEAPLFRLFDDIVAHPDASLFAVCHSFGLLCRWSGIARVVEREEKSSGMPVNALSDEALVHPWFSKFADQLPDHRHFRVVDNRLFDLQVDRSGGYLPVAFEETGSKGLTMVELARDREGIMPRVFGVNHHPEIIDREHIMTVLEEKRAHAEVTEQWYQERFMTMRDMMRGEAERQSRLTSHYTLLAPLRFQLERLVAERCGVAA